MLIKTVNRNRVRGDKKINAYTKIDIFECDQCKKQFEKATSQRKNSKRSFCSTECRVNARKLGNVGHDDFIKTCQSRFGRDNPMLPKKPKKKLTQHEKFEIRSKASKKGRITLQKNYGVSTVSKLEKVRDKLKGRKKSSDTIKKAKETLMKRYGVKCSFLIPHIRKNALSSEAQRKRISSFKMTMNKVSHPEKILVNSLKKKFNIVDIQVVMNKKWQIDIFVQELNAYIQVDGVYWHGLDRELSEIKKFKTQRDSVIYRKYMTDLEQNDWFSKQGITLIRVTDVDIKLDVNNVINAIISNCHDNTKTNWVGEVLDLRGSLLWRK